MLSFFIRLSGYLLPSFRVASAARALDITISAFCAILASLLFFLGDSAHCAESSDEEFLREFLAGEYELIGRNPDSAAAYTGRLIIRSERGSLRATRIIEDRIIVATVRFDTVAGSDRIPVLRMRFNVDGAEFEGTYRWQTDPDNYPRLTGILYRADGKSKLRGIEALFPVPR